MLRPAVAGPPPVDGGLAAAARARGDWETACREERARHDAYVRHFIHQSDLRTRLLAVERERVDALVLAEVYAAGEPPIVAADGTIDRGGQNLPGNWEAGHFNLAERLVAAIPRIGDHATMVVMHNDAVVQGLSETPAMRGVERWGVLTVGIGLGNARFSNRAGKGA